MNRRYIYEMDSDEARDFLLKKGSYSNVNFPEYLDFGIKSIKL